MAKIAAIVLGHSHLSSIINHLMSRPGEPGGAINGIQYYVIDTIRLGSDFLYSVERDGNFILNPVIEEIIERRIPADMERVYISMFGGNAHNALTLLEHPRPFDVILSENPGLPRIEGAELVPEALVKRFIAKQAEIYLLNMTSLRRFTTDPVFHVESPPPIGDNSFVLSHLEQYFQDQQSEPRVAPAPLRYKLWRLHSAIIRMACEANGVEFLSSPPEAVDSDGFLLPEAYAGDSTHAGQWYGGRILRRLEARLDAYYDGWAWLY